MHTKNIDSICGFKIEKPKLPKFSGDVREYAVLNEDFRHVIESKYSKRNAITFLWTQLQGNPLELIKGIGNDYDAAWEYLDSIYGDPRVVSDTLTQDIAKFKPLRNGEDSRFCELVHLVRRSYNTLKQVGRPSDMENSHMIAVIEQKMSPDDRKIWSRDLKREGKAATLQELLSWMTVEMKSRMRAIAPLRVTVNTNFSGTISGGLKKVSYHRCWVCQNSMHWTDQCQKFSAMSCGYRIKAVKENHACFSCLKRAGRDRRMSNCMRRKQCTVIERGKQCDQFYHPLLHSTTHPGAAGVASVAENKETLLPTVFVDILGPHKTDQANVLLDSGAQISLIRLSVAENLELRGNNVVVNLTKVGGDEESTKTKLFSLKIRSQENNSVHNIKAVGIPCISDDIVVVKLHSIAEDMNLSNDSLARGYGPVDLLIGVDHARMHTGKTRESEKLVARHSPLGWIVFRAMPKEISQVSRVYHVKFSAPVDMAEFWTTESMGVAVKPCCC